MRIAFIISEFPKLSETFILNQITGLLDKNHDIEVFAHLNPNQSKVHHAVDRYRLLNRVHYFNIPENKIIRFVKAFILVIANIHKNPLRIIKALNVFRYGKMALSLHSIYYVVPFVDRNFDIILCHFGPNGIVGIYLKDIGVEGKVITVFHGYDISLLITRNGSKMYSELFKRGDLFLPVSEHWEKKLIELGCDERKIIIHHMGINPYEFKNVNNRIKQNVHINILSVGRLVEKKGHKYAIRALSEIVKFNNDVIYLIAGDGHLKGNLVALVKELKLSQCVKFIGNVNSDEVKDLYKQADMFLLPSVTGCNGDKEGIPVVLMEASASKIPVVSTDHSGIPEVVEDGVSGFLVPEKDINSLVKKIDYLIKHPRLRMKMGEQGYNFIRENFNIEKLNDKLEKILRSTIEV